VACASKALSAARHAAGGGGDGGGSGLLAALVAVLLQWWASEAGERKELCDSPEAREVLHQTLQQEDFKGHLGAALFSRSNPTTAAAAAGATGALLVPLLPLKVMEKLQLPPRLLLHVASSVLQEKRRIATG